MIAFSGIDCAGKSTQIEIIKNYMDANRKKTRVIWSRGGYTPWIEALKTFVRPDKNYTEDEKKKYRDSISSSNTKSRLLLWASICDLIRYYGIVFRLIELRGITIICDRYLWDTYIDFKIKYPGIQFEKWMVWRILLKTYKQPEYSFILTIPAEESVRRSELKNDLHAEPVGMRKERIGMYMRLIQEGRWQHVIDAMYSIEEVTGAIMSVIH